MRVTLIVSKIRHLVKPQQTIEKEVNQVGRKAEENCDNTRKIR